MSELSLRNSIIKYSKLLNQTNLTPLRSGNISIRFKDGFLITPSGMKYKNLQPKDIVFVNFKGNLKIGKNKPSSEWRFHKDIYIDKKDSKAIVHCHSKHALILSCFGKRIPSFHYMVAVAGGEDIKCAKYATYGTSELSKNILKALRGRNACLIGNHGQVSFSNSLSKAFELAQEVEYLSEQYLGCLRTGKPKILSKSQMTKVLLKVKNYKQD
jgi:L-fuculose-phosphate aldolase